MATIIYFLFENKLIYSTIKR